MQREASGISDQVESIAPGTRSRGGIGAARSATPVPTHAASGRALGPPGRLARAGHSIRVWSLIQFTSQVFPPSSENACSKCAEVRVISDQT